jgi:sugar phosphate isomerase/epimerase
MPTAAQLSLNTATVRAQWNLHQCVDGCVRHGIGGIAPWRDKLQEAGVSEGARMIADAGLKVSGLCRGGMFTADGTLSQAVIDDNKRAVDEAVEINAHCLVMVVGGLPSGSKDINSARSTVLDGLAKTLDYARTVNMPIAIEPLHPMYAADRACVNTLGQALDICDLLDPNDTGAIGVACDVYHVWWDPDLDTQITRAAKNRLLAFHICDWLVPTRDMLLDRGMMGDGIIDIPGIRQQVEAAGFEGLNEVEIFSSENWWKRDADEVLSAMVERGASAS